MKTNPIVRAMLAWVPCPEIEQPRTRRPDFSEWGISGESARFLSKSPNALLIAAVFDRMIRAEQAWESPRLLAKRLGHFDVRRIAVMEPDALARFIGPYGGEPSLHRFRNQIADCTVAACQRLVDQYGANAQNIWNADPGAAEVLRRLQEFKGISQKIANMTVRLLITYYAVQLSGWSAVDVAVDRHVARVFLRTGLVVEGGGGPSFNVGKVREEVIQRARELFPLYPGALDEPAFIIGKEWCTAEHAYCCETEQHCPLVGACPGKRKRWQVV